MARPKPAPKSSKKSSKVPTSPQTADDYQALADDEESRGGKWRAGDHAKSARAFQRALAFYDTGLQHFPKDFDLAYNKARLQLEVSQQAVLLPHWGISYVDFLAQTLDSHRRALTLNDDEVDLLFNTAQVLTSLAEEFSALGRDTESIPLLHETLELLSSCLSKQEFMLEQQSTDELDNEEEDGGVPIDSTADQDTSSAEEVTATVIQPVTASDLLDTVHASLSALTTLLPIETEAALANLNAVAQTLLETKVPMYIQLLPEHERALAQFSIALDRAVFASTLSNARFAFHTIDLQTYASTLSAFEIPGKEQDAQALYNEAEARTEFVLSALDEVVTEVPVLDCWRQLSIAQDLLSQGTKLETAEAKELRAQLYKQKGDVELLRVRIASSQLPAITEAMRSSGTALLKNARTFYKAAVGFASSNGEDAAASSATDRLSAAQFLIDLDGHQTPTMTHGLTAVFDNIAEEGLIHNSLLERISGMSLS